MAKRATLPNIEEIQSRDPLLGRTLQHLLDVVNNSNQQTTASGIGKTRAPAPVSQIAVTGANGVASIHLSDKNAGAQGLKYLVEYSSDPNFGTFDLLDLGEATTHRLYLGVGSGTWYFRATNKFFTSERSPHVYFGSAAQPTGVAL